MGIFGDKPKHQVQSDMQGDKWLFRDQFETADEYKARLEEVTESHLIAGKAALLKYDIEKDIFSLRIEWNAWSIHFAESIELDMFLKVDRDTAKVLHGLYQDECQHPIHIKLLVGNNSPNLLFDEGLSISLQKIELYAFEQYFSCYQVADENAWEQALAINSKESYKYYQDNNQILHYYLTDAVEHIHSIDNKFEETLWSQAVNQNTIHSYQNYLAQTILHCYVDQANHNIEEYLWIEASKQNTVESYRAYLQKTQLQQYVDKANSIIKERLDELESEEVLWKQSCKNNTVEAYSAYLQKTQLGLHRIEATKNISRIKDQIETAQRAEQERVQIEYSRKQIQLLVTNTSLFVVVNAIFLYSLYNTATFLKDYPFFLAFLASSLVVVQSVLFSRTLNLISLIGIIIGIFCGLLIPMDYEYTKTSLNFNWGVFVTAVIASIFIYVKTKDETSWAEFISLLVIVIGLFSSVTWDRHVVHIHNSVEFRITGLFLFACVGSLIGFLASIKLENKLLILSSFLLVSLCSAAVIQSTLESERLAQLEQQQRELTAKIEHERYETERLNLERERQVKLAQERRMREEQEKLAQEKRMREEQERFAQERRMREEQEKLAQEKRMREEQERFAQERRMREEQERLAQERRMREEQEKLAQEKRMREEQEIQMKLAQDKRERERVAQRERLNLNFPMVSCGDKAIFRTGSQTWYPVWIEYSDSLLEKLTAEYCRDARKKNVDGTTYIQVASFATEEKAETFANLMQKEVGSGRVGTSLNISPFPMSSCGDKPSSSTQQWHPVWVEYSETTFEIIKNQYCRDAMHRYRSAKSEYYIMVASFSSRSRAEDFASFMQKVVGSGEVGEK